MRPRQKRRLSPYRFDRLAPAPSPMMRHKGIRAPSAQRVCKIADPFHFPFGSIWPWYCSCEAFPRFSILLYKDDLRGSTCTRIFRQADSDPSRVVGTRAHPRRHHPHSARHRGPATAARGIPGRQRPGELRAATGCACRIQTVRPRRPDAPIALRRCSCNQQRSLYPFGSPPISWQPCRPNSSNQKRDRAFCRQSSR